MIAHGDRYQAYRGEIAYLISEGVVSVGHADTAVCWGPGVRWGVMGPTLLFHLGGGQGGRSVDVNVTTCCSGVSVERVDA